MRKQKTEVRRSLFTEIENFKQIRSCTFMNYVTYNVAKCCNKTIESLNYFLQQVRYDDENCYFTDY